MVERVLFIIFAVFIVAGALGTITRRNIIHALILLVFTFLNVAAIFFLSQAYFVAMIQILIYAGAIMVLFVFVIMFLNLRTFRMEKQTHRQRWIAIVLSVLVLAEFVAVLAGVVSARDGFGFVSAQGGFTPEAVEAAGGNSQVFGETLFNNMLLPFEVASVVLLVALVGAVILVKKEKNAQLATRAWEPGAEPGAADSGADVAEEEV